MKPKIFKENKHQFLIETVDFFFQGRNTYPGTPMENRWSDGGGGRFFASAETKSNQTREDALGMIAQSHFHLGVNNWSPSTRKLKK